MRRPMCSGSVILSRSDLGLPVCYPVYPGGTASLPGTYEKYGERNARIPVPQTGFPQGTPHPHPPAPASPRSHEVSVGTGVAGRWRVAPCGCPPRPPSRCYNTVLGREGGTAPNCCSRPSISKFGPAFESNGILFKYSVFSSVKTQIRILRRPKGDYYE